MSAVDPRDVARFAPSDEERCGRIMVGYGTDWHPTCRLAAGHPGPHRADDAKRAAEPRPVPAPALEGDRADTEEAGLVCSWCGLTWCDGHAGGEL